MNTKERLLEFLKFLGVTHKYFEMKCGLSNGAVNNIRKSLGTDSMRKIEKNYPQINRNWLLHGEGQMLNEELTKISMDAFKTKPTSLEKLLGGNAEEIIYLKASLMVLEQMVDLSVSNQTGKTIGLVSGQRRQAVSMEAERILGEFRKKYAEL